MQRPLIKIGVMGSASTSIAAEGRQRVDALAVRLGEKIAAAACVLITGSSMAFQAVSSQCIASTAVFPWASRRRIQPSSTPPCTTHHRVPRRW